MADSSSEPVIFMGVELTPEQLAMAEANAITLEANVPLLQGNEDAALRAAKLLVVIDIGRIEKIDLVQDFESDVIIIDDSGCLCILAFNDYGSIYCIYNEEGDTIFAYTTSFSIANPPNEIQS